MNNIKITVNVNKLNEVAKVARWGEAETCPFCDADNFYPYLVGSMVGYKMPCLNCGKEIFLCDACKHDQMDEDSKYKCDYCKEGNCGVCFRGRIEGR